ncbi:hypothetical protein BH09MYX1_BH09MYX1_24780 [soil metagenome]
MRFALAALLALHGAIHLLGFLAAWKLRAIPGMTGKTIVALGETATRVVGSTWLVASLLLLTSAALVLADRDGWWIPASIGVVVSQALIVLQWSEARAGTIVNALLIVPVLVGAATARFHAESAQEVQSLVARAKAAPALAISEAEVAKLPPPIARWLTRSGVTERVRVVRLRQRGRMWMSPGARAMPTTAEQWFTTDEPGFAWAAEVTMLGVLPIVGRDRYVDGHGRMKIEAGAIITLADGRGEKIDQGTLLRFLSEMVWFPSAVLAPYVSWTSVDDHAAIATMTWRGITASARVDVDDLGRVRGLTARRYFGTDGVLEDWIITADGWQRFAGVEVPAHAMVSWQLASGRFDYFELDITALDYDPPAAPHDLVTSVAER